jgi:UDP-N-acetylmuramoyl-tripeptide--D-alanyl-D-alanine ligase
MSQRDTPGLERCERPVIAVTDPVGALASMAGARRRQLRARVVGVTGSYGKTSTKDILSTMLAQRFSVVSTLGNKNTTAGVAAAILGAPPSTAALVLEIGTRQHGGIREVTDFARPEVGVIVSIGPSHLTLLGGIDGVARAKAELIEALPAGGTCIIPVGTPLLEPYLRDDVDTVRFGEGGDVQLRSFSAGMAEIDAFSRTVVIRPSYDQRHLLHDTLAAVAASVALGHVPHGRVAPNFLPNRCETIPLGNGVTLINDCYSASPPSMRSAIEHLASVPARRRIAVLGKMAELGDESEAYHVEVGRLASQVGVDEIITVGKRARTIAAAFGRECVCLNSTEEAAALVPRVMRSGDVILVKGCHYHNLDQVRAACVETVTSSEREARRGTVETALHPAG